MRGPLLLMTMLIVLECCDAQSRNDSIRLMEEKLRGYSKKHRPVLNYSHPVQVNVTFDVVSLQEFDEVHGVLSVVLLMSMTWNDEIIKWNPASYGGISYQVYSVEDVWYPFLVTASSTEDFRDLAENWMTLRILASGFVHFRLGILVKSSCGMDVSHYPFDIQNCYVMFVPWSNNEQEIKLYTPEPHARRYHYTENGQWSIIANSTFVNQYNVLNVHFKLERKSLFVVVNTILPIILMLALNVLVFVLPADSGERMSYTITVLLAIAVFLTLIADNLPQTSEPMSVLAFFLLVNLILSCLICITTILNLRTFHKQHNQEIPLWLQRLTCIVGCSSTTYSVRRKHSNRSKENSTSEINTGNGDVTGISHNTAKSNAIDQQVTWSDISTAIDKLLITVFSIACAINTIVFLLIVTVR